MNTSKPPKGFEKLTTAQLIVPKILAILKRNHAPADWGWHEANLIWDWFFVSRTVNAIKFTKKNNGWTDCFIPGFPDKRGKINQLQYQRLVRTLTFAKMFADAPQTMIKSLPEIQKKMSISPMQALAYEAVAEIEVANVFKKKPPTDFWTKKTNELKPKGGTPKTVEHARKFLRQSISPKISK